MRSNLSDISKDTPKFDSPEWWACVVSLRLRNLDLVLSRHKHAAYEHPVDLQRLPHYLEPQADDLALLLLHQSVRALTGPLASAGP